MDRRSSWLISLITFASFAHAGLFITYPYEGVTCTGGSSCQVIWADDGNTPLLSAIGSSDIALYEGTDTLVQQLASGLDVSQTLQLTFTPNSAAGPDASDYFIQVTSLNAKSENDSSEAYTAFSGFFTLDNMSGTAGEPVASLTSSLASTTAATSSGSQSTSSFSTNGVVSTTTLPDTATTAASALSSALSAISSAATGSLSSGTSSTSSGSHSSSTSATGSAAQSSSSTSASSRIRTIPLANAITFIGFLSSFIL